MVDGIAKIFLGYVLSVLVAGVPFGGLVGSSSGQFSASDAVSGAFFAALVVAIFAFPVAIPSVIILMACKRKRYVEYAICAGLCPLFTAAILVGANPVLSFLAIFSFEGLLLFLTGAVSAYPMWAICTNRWRLFDHDRRLPEGS